MGSYTDLEERVRALEAERSARLARRSRWTRAALWAGATAGAVLLALVVTALWSLASRVRLAPVELPVAPQRDR